MRYLLGLLLLRVCLLPAYQVIPHSLEKKPLLVTGVISSIPAMHPHHVSFDFDSEQLQRLHLSWYSKYQRLVVGDKWRFTVKLKQPHGLNNPGGFDSKKYFRVNKIAAKGYVFDKRETLLLRSDFSSYPIDRVRQHIAERLMQIDSPWIGLLIALTVGVRNYISNPTWQLFRATGTSHLMAISGLHIGLIASLFFMIFKLFWRRVPRLCLYMPASKAAAIAAIIAAIFYATLAGFSVTSQRALIMVIVYMSGLILNKNINIINSYLTALLLVLLINPLAVLTTGFWLSFTAVGIIIYTTLYRQQQEKNYKRLGRMQLAITLGLLPISLYIFQQFSLVGVVANLIAIPYVGMLIVPLTLISTMLLLIAPTVGHYLVLLTLKCLIPLYWLLTKLAQLPYANCWHAIPNYLVLFGVSYGVLWLLTPRGWPNRYLGLCGFLPLFFYTPQVIKPGEVRLTLLDVGQGLAAVVRTTKHTLVYDTGPKFEAFDTGQAVILPYLRTLGINKIDTLIVSHGDNDHSGGAHAILNNIVVQNILTSVPEKFKNFNAQACFSGQHWIWSGAKFEIISPDQGSGFLGNNASCVLRIKIGTKSVLLTGDIERNTERVLVQQKSPKLVSTILIAPHHGSRTSSTKKFVQAVHPEYVLFPIGYLNRFHFPSKQVVRRYQAIGSKMLDTAHSGAIDMVISKDKVIFTKG